MAESNKYRVTAGRNCRKVTQGQHIAQRLKSSNNQQGNHNSSNKYNLKGDGNTKAILGNRNVQGTNNHVVYGDLVQHFHSNDDTIKQLLGIIVEQNKQILALTERLLESR